MEDVPIFKLIGRPGWGSVMVEAQLAWYGLDYTVENIEDLFKSTEARERLKQFNFLAQVPMHVRSARAGAEPTAHRGASGALT